jgi:hypothetical protein
VQPGDTPPLPAAVIPDARIFPRQVAMDAASPNKPTKVTTMAQKQVRKPTHGVFYVREGKNGGKGFWTRIGAAWMHDDSKGLNIMLDLIPAGDGKIVVRVDEPKTTGEAATEGQGEPK